MTTPKLDTSKYTERARVVACMEYIARHVNNEELFYDFWLYEGVADGDIEYGNLNPYDVPDFYTEDEAFEGICAVFMQLMSHARKDGGLCIFAE